MYKLNNRPDPVLKDLVLHSAVRKLALALEDEDGCLDVEAKPANLLFATQLSWARIVLKAIIGR